MTIATRVKFTYDDLRLFPNDGKRHELIDGEHIMTSAPNTAHQNAVANLFGLFYAFVRKHKLGRVFTSPFDVVFSNFDVAEPDIVFISRSREKILTKQNARGAPDLVVEVLSPSTQDMDRQVKFKLYEKYRVSEYWMVDPDKETIEIYALRANDYELLGAFSSRQKVRSEILRGFSCAANQVFEA